MSEWKEYRLGDILTIRSGFSYKGKFIGRGNSLLLGMGCVSYLDKFIMSGARPYSGPFDERYKVYPGDIVLATRQQSDNLPILAMPAMVPKTLIGKDLIIGTNLYKVEITDKSFSNEYIYWMMKTKRYVNYIKGVKTGTTVSMVTKKNVEDFTFFAPTDPRERESLVSIISSLDSKIENNRKICANLEAQAQALFKHWFIDFAPFKDGKFVESELGMIPEGWRVGSILDIAELYDYQRKPLSSMEREGMKGDYPYYGATSIMDYIDKYIFDGTYVLMGEDGSVVKDNGCPYLQYVWGKFWPNNHAHVMQGKNGFSTEMLYCFLSITDVRSIVTGAVQMKISQRSMSHLLTVIPPKSVCGDYNRIIRPLFDLIKSTKEENVHLSNLRDTLLHKLMSEAIQT